MFKEAARQFTVKCSQMPALVNEPIKTGLIQGANWGTITGIALSALFCYAAKVSAYISFLPTFSISLYSMIQLTAGLATGGALLGAALTATVAYYLFPRLLTLDEFVAMTQNCCNRVNWHEISSYGQNPDEQKAINELWISFYDQNPDKQRAICEQAFHWGTKELFNVLHTRGRDFSDLSPMIALVLGVHFKDTNLIINLLDALEKAKAGSAEQLVNTPTHATLDKLKYKYHLPALCIIYGHDLEFIKKLFTEYGAKNDSGSYDDTVLRVAATYGRADIVEFLIDEGFASADDLTNRDHEYASLTNGTLDLFPQSKGAPLHRALVGAYSLLAKEGCEANMEGAPVPPAFTDAHEAIEYEGSKMCADDYKNVIQALVERGAPTETSRAEVLILDIQSSNSHHRTFEKLTPLQLARHIDAQLGLTEGKRLENLLIHSESSEREMVGDFDE